jgi:outer membrane lipoprotein-sorting protein
MLTLKNIRFIAFIFIISYQGYSQNPKVLLNQIQSKLNKVNTYKADINIKVDLPYIIMMPIKTKLYFKQKDKFKIDTKHIAIFPKQGFFQFNRLINDSINYTAAFQSHELINGIKTTLINLIPNNDTSDVILAKLWIDGSNQVILKSQITTKSSGTIKTEYSYNTQIKFGLPDKIKFVVDVKKFKIPKALAADINTSTSKKVEKKSGEILVVLSNYEINKGISDSFFNK